MLRTTTLVTALSLLTMPCFAGFYLGGAIGPEGASFTQKAHVVGAIQPSDGSALQNFDVIDKNHFSGIGGFGSLFAGYGWVHNRFYLAGEINANLSSVIHELSNFEQIHNNLSKTTFTVKSSQGIGLLPGFFLSEDTLFYGRIGYVNGHIRINESDPTINSINKNRNGVRYGVGLRHDLTPRWTVMMDYSQINYGNLYSNVIVPTVVTKDTKISTNTAQVAFGAIYNFDVPAEEIITKD